MFKKNNKFSFILLLFQKIEDMNLYEHLSNPVVRFTINLNKIDFYDTENMVDNCKY